jgi:hypothetical protein
MEPASPASGGQKTKREALVQTARRLFEMGKLDEAAKTLKEVVEQDPANQAAYYYLNLIRESRGNARKEGLAASEPHFIPNFLGRPRVTLNSEARKAIYAKLDSIRLDRVRFDSLALGEIVGLLNAEARKRDPAGQGVNFLISSSSNNPTAGGTLEDVSSVRIKIVPALVDVRLADVLDAVVKVADKPIKYSVEDYAVVFAWKGDEPAPLYARIIKVDLETFNQGLESVAGVSSLQPTGAEAKQELLREFFQTLGVDLKGPKSAQWRCRSFA